jgi:hypothetical protein
VAERPASAIRGLERRSAGCAGFATPAEHPGSTIVPPRRRPPPVAERRQGTIESRPPLSWPNRSAQDTSAVPPSPPTCRGNRISPARPRRAPGSGELSPANEAREPSRPPPSLRWRICISRGRNGNDGRDRASFISGFAGIVRPSRKLVSGAQWPGDHRRWNQGSLPHQR